MSLTQYSCIAKSHDGGQRFYDIRQNDYVYLVEKVAFENSCVKINTIPSGCPITDAWASPASDSREVAAYIRTHGRHAHYNGLKPRWLLVNLRARDVWANFSVNSDLMLENVIALRGKSNDECAAIVDKSLGGPFVDYNLYPMTRNITSGVVSNWSWWKSIEFIMRVWLLSQKEEAVVVYQVLVDYADPDRPDRPTHFTYAVRFVAVDSAMQKFLTTCFENIVNVSSDQPADFQQFYSYSVERAYLSKTLQKIKRLTGERLQLEDKEKDGIEQRSTVLVDGSRASIKEQIQVKWEALQSSAQDVQNRAAGKVSRFFVQKPKDVRQKKKSYNSNDDEDDDDDASSTCSYRSNQSSSSNHKLVIKGIRFHEQFPLKKAVSNYFQNTLGLKVTVMNAYQMTIDQKGVPVICVLMESIKDSEEVLKMRNVAPMGAEISRYIERKPRSSSLCGNGAKSVVYPKRNHRQK